jgi:hypothetical protein
VGCFSKFIYFRNFSSLSQGQLAHLQRLHPLFPGTEFVEDTWFIPAWHRGRGVSLWAQQQASESLRDVSASVLGRHMLGVIFSDLRTEPEALYFIHSFVQYDLGY